MKINVLIILSLLFISNTANADYYPSNTKIIKDVTENDKTTGFITRKLKLHTKDTMNNVVFYYAHELNLSCGVYGASRTCKSRPDGLIKPNIIANIIDVSEYDKSKNYILIDLTISTYSFE